jgi:hypothetical protein
MYRQSSPARLFLALTALCFQLVSGAGMVAPASSDAGPARLQALAALLPGADIICHTETEDGSLPSKPSAPGQQHHGDCAICPVCHAFAQPVAMPAGSPVVPRRSAAVTSLAAPPPPATAPPTPVWTHVQPRAPPILT